MPRKGLPSSHLIRALSATLVATALVAGPVVAQEADGCSHFAWDVSHALDVMKLGAKTVSAATQVGSGVPLLSVDTLYEVKLAPQAKVTYAVPPAKPTLNDSAQGGLVAFEVRKAGVYRVAITSGHWIDVAEGAQLITSKDFTGSRSCERLHKIVEFELPPNKALTLQFSGSTDATVKVSITAAPATANASAPSATAAPASAQH